MNNRFLLLIFVFISLRSYSQTSTLKEYSPAIYLEVNPDLEEYIKGELEKPFKVVRFLSAENPRINFELKVWKSMVSSVDTDLIGFVFYLDQESKKIEEEWGQYFSEYPRLSIDHKGAVKSKNQVLGNLNSYTLLLDHKNRIIKSTGSPIVPENFDLIRSVLGHELKNMGYERGISGPITDSTKGNPTWFMNEPVYIDPSGKIIGEDELKRILENGGVYLEYTLSDTVRLRKH